LTGRDRAGISDAVSDFRQTNEPPRRGRSALLIAVALLAVAAALLVAGYALRRFGWIGGQDNAAVPSAQAPAPAPAPTVNAPQTAIAAAIDPATLAGREAALSAQLAALEARTAAITNDTAAAGSQAGRAEALLVAVASRRALDHGQGLGYLEPQLRARFAAAQPRAVDMVIDVAHQPVTLEDLRQGLDAIAPTVVSGAGQGWLFSLRRELSGLIVLRQTTTPSPLPADRLARARRLLDSGQVEAARAEVIRLPGARDAGNWLEAARRYVLARRALDVLENTALVGMVPPTAPV
jgi:hypothetical protein